MSSATDPYLEWNAAYVLGSLPPSERREYEHHLADCQNCSRSVTSLAGMAGILASVRSESAFALLEGDSAAGGHRDAPATLLPGLLRAVHRQRLRTRIGVAALVVAVAATVLTVPLLALRDEPAWQPQRITMSQTAPSPLTAEVALIAQAWGTRIEGVCRYAQPTDGTGIPRDYVMYLTTTDGTSTQIASWTASPGSELAFAAMTRVHVGQIGSIDIRLADRDLVLLRTTF